MFKKVLILSILTLFGVSEAAARQPIFNVEHAPYVTSSGEKPTNEQIEKAFIAAAQTKRWVAHVVRPGLISAYISVRSHRAEITMEYTSDEYNITYQDSYHLDYKEGQIHRNYNKWIILLDRVFRENINKY